MTGISHDLFVCHARSDGADAATALTRDLEQRGLTCWIAPRDIAPGMSWPNAIVDGITRSRAMVLLVTEAANASPEVEKEVSLAAHLHKTRFPVRVSDIPLAGTLLYHLQTRQWRDLFDDRERALDEIAEQVRRLRGEAAVAADTPLAAAAPAGMPPAPHP